MITYQQLKDKYNGKFVEVAGSSNALNQCVDLVNAKIREVDGQPIVEHCNAQDFPAKVNGNYEKINNSPKIFPIQGDIVVFSSPDGIGHISICDSADVNKVISFDQNWPLKSPCHLVIHKYTGTYKITCWLRL